MHKKIILILALVEWTTLLPAQITRKQADAIVKAHLQNEMVECKLLYVNVNDPDVTGTAVMTSNEEVVKAKYACWAYYLNESERSQCRYLFVKEDNGNLLEVIASNDLGQSDLTQWETLDNVGIVETDDYPSLPQIYPNPTTGQLTISLPNSLEGGAYEAESVEIYDVLGKRKCFSAPSLLERAGGEVIIDLSHFPTGIYYLSLYGEKRVIYKVVKQ